VSRTRCSALHAAPQSRNPRQRGVQNGPRISSAPRREERRAAQHPGHASLVLAPNANMPSRPRGAMRPSRAFISRPKEGVGNAGCPLHPRPRVRFAFGKKHTSIRVHRNHPAFPHAPRVRDDRDTPLWWRGMRKVLDVIWVRWEQKYLSENPKKDSTALSTNRPTGKSPPGLTTNSCHRSPSPARRRDRNHSAAAN
jgi:hypothetical protein